MYVCVRNAVTERDIERAALLGGRGLPELTGQTGCGSGYGSCRELAEPVSGETVACLRATTN